MLKALTSSRQGSWLIELATTTVAYRSATTATQRQRSRRAFSSSGSLTRTCLGESREPARRGEHLSPARWPPVRRRGRLLASESGRQEKMPPFLRLHG